MYVLIYIAPFNKGSGYYAMQYIYAYTNVYNDYIWFIHSGNKHNWKEYQIKII